MFRGNPAIIHTHTLADGSVSDLIYNSLIHLSPAFCTFQGQDMQKTTGILQPPYPLPKRKILPVKCVLLLKGGRYMIINYMVSGLR